MHKFFVIVLVIVLSACTQQTTKNYYYEDAQDGSAGAQTSSAASGGSAGSPEESATAGAPDAAGSPGIIIEEEDIGTAGASGSAGDASTPENETNVSCELNRIVDLGSAVSLSSITASTDGFLAQWRSNWNSNSLLQAFDLNGQEVSDESILTNSSSSVHPVVGSSRGYVAIAEGSEKQLVRLDHDGSIICSKPIAPSTFDLLTADGEREIYITENFDFSTLTYFIKLYYVADDCRLVYIDGYTHVAEKSIDSLTINAIAQHENKLLIVQGKTVYAADDINSNRTASLSYVIYDLSQNRFFNGPVFYGPETNHAFTHQAHSTPSGFAIIWGTNHVPDYERLVTNVTADGMLGLTYDIAVEQPLGNRYINSNRLLVAGYDEATMQRSFLMYSATGAEQLVELPISIGRNYYLGSPQIATDGKGNYAMSWVEEDESYADWYHVAFFHCTE